MKYWETWVRHPQSLRFRKALFQVHSCVGIVFGLYLLAMSLSGSLLVFRDELSRAFARPPLVVAPHGSRMGREELRQAAARRYPGYEVTEVYERQNRNQAVEVTLVRGNRAMERLFDPFTGADLGNRFTVGFRFLLWAADLHSNLLLGMDKRWVNGTGALLFTVLALTGSVIWWPGIGAWRRRLKIDWTAQAKRLIWTTHTTLGFWLYGFVLLWAVSGVYLCFPVRFDAILNLVEPRDPNGGKIRLGALIFASLSEAHFGRFAGPYVKALWTVTGLTPAALFITGAVMWWNRVLQKRVREWEHEIEARRAEAEK